VAPPPAAEQKLDVAQLQAEAVAAALVPSPAEMQKALTNAGISTQLAELVKDNKFKMDATSKDQLAVCTGVVLADLVLTIKTATKEQKLDRLNRLKQGFNGLGGGADVVATIDDLSGRIANDAVSPDDLIKEIDELSGVMVPELKLEAGDWVVPLIQAGSWLEGSNLVSAALQKAGKYDPIATGLLRQPAVVDHFITYVNHEGKDKAPDQVVARLNETLSTLKVVANKETLTEQDVATVQSATSAVLTMLN